MKNGWQVVREVAERSVKYPESRIKNQKSRMKGRMRRCEDCLYEETRAGGTVVVKDLWEDKMLGLGRTSSSVWFKLMIESVGFGRGVGLGGQRSPGNLPACPANHVLAGRPGWWDAVTCHAACRRHCAAPSHSLSLGNLWWWMGMPRRRPRSRRTRVSFWR